jgi:hypothetical protein
MKFKNDFSIERLKQELDSKAMVILEMSKDLELLKQQNQKIIDIIDNRIEELKQLAEQEGKWNAISFTNDLIQELESLKKEVK